MKALPILLGSSSDHTYKPATSSQLKELNKWIIKRVPQEENGKTNTLAEITASLLINGTIMLPIYLKVAPSITLGPICNIDQTDSGWILDIIKYLQIGDVPKNRKQTHKLHIQPSHFTLINDQLYKRSFRGSYLKCLSKPDVKYILVELHEGVWVNHPGGRTLAYRAYMEGY